MGYIRWARKKVKKVIITDIFFTKLALIFFGFLLIYWIPAILTVNAWIWFALFIITGLMACRVFWRK